MSQPPSSVVTSDAHLRASRFGALGRAAWHDSSAPVLAWKRDRVPPGVWLAFIAGYGVLATLSAELATAKIVSPWYPPVGLSLAIVLACGWRAMPLIFVADTVQLLLRGGNGDLLDCVAQGLTQAVLWGVIGLLLRPRLTVEPALSRLRDVLWFAFATIAGSAVVALAGVALLLTLQADAWTAYWETVRVYFIGDAIGILTVTPALLVLAGMPARAPQAVAALREALALGPEFWAMLAATLLVPAVAIQGSGDLLPIAPLPMAWVALRLGMPAASIGLLLWSLSAVVAFSIGESETGLWLISASMVSGGLLAIFAGAVVTERERGRARLAYLALHDELTGLPNRLSFEQSVAAALKRDDRRVAVLLVRLTGLATEAGAVPEPVLLAAADRLRRLTGPESTIARVGGRRFVVLVDGPEASKAGELAERLVAGLEPPVVIDGFEYLLGPVVGTADASVGDGADAALSRATRAANAAALDGSTAAAYADLAQGVEEEIELAGELRAAIGTPQLSLAFQPIASIRSGSVAGAEALLRWTHPGRGAIGPNEFIPVAEDCGLILPLGRWVLHEACRLAAEWPVQQDPLDIHVNVSPIQLRDEGLIDDVRGALEASGLPPSRLCLELTESGLFDDLDVAAKRILSLNDLGVRVVLDDFGTGHSSLQWLQRLPVTALKIDRSFVSGIDTRPVDLAIVQATLGLAQLLKLDTVAEGVETAEQLAVLREEGCTSIQGYLLLRPMPDEQFLGWLAEYVPVVEATDQTMF
ncbi:MAG: EAL domain-containing protein [Solirubrobacteraceae bacterium]|nr:EAL domain-containing protein [Solirubrobacteraceae bacterium]